MQSVKHVAATAKEKASNAIAKVVEKLLRGKASANEKIDKVFMLDDVKKQGAKEKKHENKARAKAKKVQKKLDNEQERNELKHDFNTCHATAADAYKNVDTSVRDHTTT